MANRKRTVGLLAFLRGNTDPAAGMPDGIFDVIYADPPWQYGDNCCSTVIHNCAIRIYAPMVLAQHSAALTKRCGVVLEMAT